MNLKMTDGGELSAQRASTKKRWFSRETSVSANINAEPNTVWKLLTDAENMASWNSTIVELKGKIAPGERILLVSSLDPNRRFKLRIKEFESPTSLVWGDAMGTRTYRLQPNSQGGTHFSMLEKIGGPLYPLFSRMIPSFDESFDQFAADLASVAEAENL